MQAPPSQDEINLYNEYWNTLSGNSNAQVLPEHIIVNFYKASNLNNQCLEEIWRLSNPNNVKSISKAEFFLGVRLIALAQQGYNVSNLPMNITIPQPMFRGFENVLIQFQNKKMYGQQSSFNNMNSQPVQQTKLLTSSFMTNSSNNTNKVYSFGNNTSPIEWFIRQAKRNEFSDTFEKFQKNTVFHYDSLKDLVKDEPVNQNDLDKIWALLDKYNIKVIRKGQFIIFMHILESCKNGDAIPNSIPYSIIQSTGAEKEMEDRTIPSEPQVPDLLSSNNNNNSNPYDFFNNTNNNNNSNSTSFFNNNNNNTSFFNSNNNDSTSFFNNNNNNNSNNNNNNNNNNNLNNNLSFFNENNNMNNNMNNQNQNQTSVFGNNNNNNNNILNSNNKNDSQTSFFDDKNNGNNNNIFSNNNNNIFNNNSNNNNNVNQIKAINVASLEDYSNLLDYKKKYLESLKSDISKIQIGVDNLNNNKYSDPTIYSNLENLIQSINTETLVIKNSEKDIQ
jgi:hypothetical protein